jgi:hypothetical protein
MSVFILSRKSAGEMGGGHHITHQQLSMVGSHTLFQVIAGSGSPWELHGSCTLVPTSTVRSLGVLANTGVTGRKACSIQHSGNLHQNASEELNPTLRLTQGPQQPLHRAQLPMDSEMNFLLLPALGSNSSGME